MYESYKLSDYRKFDKSNSIDIWKYPHESLFQISPKFPQFFTTTRLAPEKSFPSPIPIRNLYTQHRSLAEQIFSRHKANARKNSSHHGKKNLSCTGNRARRRRDPRAGKEFSPREGDGRFHGFASSIFHLASS